MFINGESFNNDIYPPIPQGLIAYGSVGSHLPSPSYGAEGSLYELDANLFAGRMYMFALNDINITWPATGGVAAVRVRYTTDGTVPGTGSTQFMSARPFAESGNTFQFITSVTRIYIPATDLLMRALVTLQGNLGTPTTCTITNLGAVTDAAPQAALAIYDIGASTGDTGIWIGGGTSGGTSPTTHVKTYTNTSTHSYQGSDGGNPNQKINDNGICYQGGDRGNTYNGRSKSWIQFNAAAIAADLSGATISKTEVFLNNNHTWYNSGMNAAIGWDNVTTFPATRGDPSGAGVDLSDPAFNEGQQKWVTVSNAIATNFQNGNATGLVLFRNSNSLTYYGYFAGSGSTYEPKLRITYRK
jgi:hypothetical protein